MKKLKIEVRPSSHKKKKGKSERRGEADVTRTSGDEDSDMKKAKAASLFSGKPKGDEESDERNRDRGPFGEGFGVSYGDDESDSTESDFRKGPSTPAKSGQLKLIRYSSKYPGRLASRMLVKMEQATARGVGGPFAKRSSLTPPVAMNHMLTVLIPSQGRHEDSARAENAWCHSGPPCRQPVRQSSRCCESEDQSSRTSDSREALGGSSVPRVTSPRGNDVAGSGRGDVLSPRISPRSTAEELRPAQEVEPRAPREGGGKEKGQKGDKGGKDAKGGGKKNQWSEKGERKGEEKGSA